MIGRAAWIAVLVSLVAGCGDIPQPFRHDGEPSLLARPKMTRGVAIRPPAEGDEGEMIAQSLVQAFEQQDIPALVQTGQAFGYQVEGQAEDRGSVLDVTWVLKGPDGTAAATSRQVVPKALLVAADAKSLKRTADASALALSLPLADPDAQPVAQPRSDADSRPQVRITPLRGLPGDGDRALFEAMRTALIRNHLKIADDGATYVIEGRVTVAPGSANEDMVTVAWVLKRSEDGKEVANIAQSGAVPKGRLNQSWGSLARDIAEGGASGIEQGIRADGRMKKPERP